MIDLIRNNELDRALELLHFAFRAVIAKPDRMLKARGLSRVHHRILFFVRNNPGLSVGKLLKILNVSKQALNGPLNILIRKKLVSFTSSQEDRRVKCIHLTDAGQALENMVSGDQRDRFQAAFKRVGKEKEEAWREIMRLVARKDYK